jgi:hypothetical protein
MSVSRPFVLLISLIALSNTVFAQSGSSSDAFSVPASGFISSTTVVSGQTIQGFATVDPASSSLPPAALEVFSFKPAGVLTSAATIPAQRPMQDGRIYFDRPADRTDQADVGIVILNPGNSSVSISYYFTDNGTRTSARTFPVGPFSQISGYLSGFTEPFGTFTFHASSPIAVFAVRTQVNELGNFLQSTVPVVDLNKPHDQPVAFTAFAVGGGAFSTDVVLTNPTDQTITGSLSFFSQASNTPLTVVLDGNAGTQFTYSIPGGSSQRSRLSSASSFETSGWVSVASSNGSAYPSGFLTISEVGQDATRGTFTLDQFTIPASESGQAYRLYAENSDASSSLFALLNPSQSDMDVMIALTDTSGNSIVAPQTVHVPAAGEISTCLCQIAGFGNLPNPMKGVLRFSTSSSQGFYLLGALLKINQRGESLIATVDPVREGSIQATSQYFLPAVVDGSGFSTQIVVYSSDGNPTSGALNFYSQGGTSIKVPLQ